MPSNGNRFEGAYNKIDALLRKKVGTAKTLSFSAVVDEAAKKDATVRACRDNLLEYGELRNAIVHDRGKAPVLLADPRNDVVLEIEKIWGRLSRPKALRSLPRSVPLRIFAATAILAESLSYMRANDFSQVIIVRDGRHTVLSTEGVARWLEAKSKEDIIALSEARLSDVLDFEPMDSCVYLRADDTVDRTREVFANDIGKRIFSALVTEHGAAKEKPIHIVTPWDFVTGKLRWLSEPVLKILESPESVVILFLAAKSTNGDCHVDHGSAHPSPSIFDGNIAHFDKAHFFKTLSKNAGYQRKPIALLAAMHRFGSYRSQSKQSLGDAERSSLTHSGVRQEAGKE
jgi:hypothetical protein